MLINTLRPGKMAAIFQTTFSHAFSWMKIYEFRKKISLTFVPKGPIENIPALVQLMAWRRPGNKPLSEPMMVVLPAHTCVTRPQWVNIMVTFFFNFQSDWISNIYNIMWLRPADNEIDASHSRPYQQNDAWLHLAIRYEVKRIWN